MPGDACYIKGASQLVASAEASLRIKTGETTEDGNISLVSARCIGSCSMAPAFIFDGETAGNVDETALHAKLAGWTNW